MLLDLVNQCIYTEVKIQYTSLLKKKMLEESKNCKEIIKNHFKEELVINKENERQIELILF